MSIRGRMFSLMSCWASCSPNQLMRPASDRFFGLQEQWAEDKRDGGNAAQHTHPFREKCQMEIVTLPAKALIPECRDKQTHLSSRARIGLIAIVFLRAVGNVTPRTPRRPRRSSRTRL